jgi:hypothetical protein
VSDYWRQRRLWLSNRLAELEAKYGPSEQSELPSLDCEPSWGPLGCLLEQHLHPLEYDHLRAVHYDLVALERMRLQPSSEPTNGQAPPQTPAEFEATHVELA